jgi:hypothetical protein
MTIYFNTLQFRLSFSYFAFFTVMSYMFSFVFYTYLQKAREAMIRLSPVMPQGTRMFVSAVLER